MIQQNVAGLDVTVVDRRLHGRVEVRDGRGDVGCDGDASVPRQAVASLPAEVLGESAVGHELIHQDVLAALDAAAQQADDVGVADGGDELDLVYDEVDVVVFEPFDGDDAGVGEFSDVHGGVVAGAEHGGAGEVAGGAFDVLEGEGGDGAGCLREKASGDLLPSGGGGQASGVLAEECHAKHQRDCGEDACEKTSGN